VDTRARDFGLHVEEAVDDAHRHNAMEGSCSDQYLLQQQGIAKQTAISYPCTHECMRSAMHFCLCQSQPFGWHADNYWP